MIVKFYNNWTGDEAFVVFPKGTSKSERNKIRLKWVAENISAPENWKEDEDWNSEVEDAYVSSEETVVKIRRPESFEE